MISGRYKYIFKILIVSAFTYSAFRLIISPNGYKDLYLVIWIISSILALLVTIFDKKAKNVNTCTATTAILKNTIGGD